MHIKQVFDYFAKNEYKRISPKMRQILQEWVGEEATKVEGALAEAVINGLEYGSKVRVKISKTGQKLVIRVRDKGPGFAGNAALAALIAQGTDNVFLDCLLAENGRGLPIMLAWMDKVLYNKTGNEVLLLKKLS